MNAVSIEEAKASISFSPEEFEILNGAVNYLKYLPERAAKQYATSRQSLASTFTNWHGWGMVRAYEKLLELDEIDKEYDPLIHNGMVVAILGRLPIRLLASVQTDNPVLQTSYEDIKTGVPEIKLVVGSADYFHWLYMDMDPEAVDRLSDRLAPMRDEIEYKEVIEVDDPSHSTGLNVFGLNLFTGKAALAVYNIPFEDQRYDAGLIIDTALTEQVVDVSIAQRDADGNHIHNAIINNLPHLRLV